MPARVVVVLSEPGFADKAASALQAQGQDALPLADPMTALELLERAERLELLVTCLDFPPGKPNGIALGRMARLKRPGIRVLFVGPADLEQHAEGLGTFMISPVTVPQIVEGVLRTLDTAPAEVEGSGAQAAGRPRSMSGMDHLVHEAEFADRCG
jgi:hypothetical protein